MGTDVDGGAADDAADGNEGDAEAAVNNCHMCVYTYIYIYVYIYIYI